ncbi:MAG: PepSY-like domain-containing protein [Aequorivita sp.]|nr:PepSY-like domain-containing protein [Aequorivita sp.]
MKNIYLVALVVLCASVAACAQKKVPSTLDSAFKTKFLNATNITWNKENTHEYEAEFIMSGTKYSANFSDTGKWLETEHLITYDELPKAVQQSFMASHKEVQVKTVAKIENSEGTTSYEIEVKQLLGTKELFYDANGKEIQEEDSED